MTDDITNEGNDSYFADKAGTAWPSFVGMGMGVCRGYALAKGAPFTGELEVLFGSMFAQGAWTYHLENKTYSVSEKISGANQEEEEDIRPGEYAVVGAAGAGLALAVGYAAGLALGFADTGIEKFLY